MECRCGRFGIVCLLRRVSVKLLFPGCFFVVCLYGMVREVLSGFRSC